MKKFIMLLILSDHNLWAPKLHHSGQNSILSDLSYLSKLLTVFMLILMRLSDLTLIPPLNKPFPVICRHQDDKS